MRCTRRSSSSWATRRPAPVTSSARSPAGDTTCDRHLRRRRRSACAPPSRRRRACMGCSTSTARRGTRAAATRRRGRWPMSDDIRRWSDALARDPSSTVFLQLGEALRRQGDAEFALRVALRGLERHPHLAEAHDLLARIAADAGDLQRAFDEWDMVIRLAPGHAGALKGMGFVCYRQGALAAAERYLGEASERDPADASIATALAHVRASLADAEG